MSAEDTSPTPVRVHAAAMDRATRAASMRVAGVPWARVAQEVGYSSPQNCMRAVRDLYGSMPEIDTTTARALLRERAEVVWRQVQLDMKEGRSGATRSATALLQRMSALDGTDAPTTVAFVTPSDSEVSRVVAELVALRREQLGTSQAEEADPFADDYLDAQVLEGEPGADR